MLQGELFEKRKIHVFDEDAATISYDKSLLGT
jgi:hypothetical protein